MVDFETMKYGTVNAKQEMSTQHIAPFQWRISASLAATAFHTHWPVDPDLGDKNTYVWDTGLTDGSLLEQGSPSLQSSGQGQPSASKPPFSRLIHHPAPSFHS